MPRTDLSSWLGHLTFTRAQRSWILRPGVCKLGSGQRSAGSRGLVWPYSFLLGATTPSSSHMVPGDLPHVCTICPAHSRARLGWASAPCEASGFLLWDFMPALGVEGATYTAMWRTGAGEREGGSQGPRGAGQTDRQTDRILMAFHALISVSGASCMATHGGDAPGASKLPFADFCLWSPREA